MAGLLPQVSSHQDVNVDDLHFKWYFSRKEIEENSPSRRDGIDLKKETYLRKSYCTFLQDLGMRLKVPQVTIATAIVFCHRFFLRQSHAKNDRRTIATVCMFLAGKVEETPRLLKDVILVSYEIIHKKDPSAVQRIKQKEVYEQQKELILIGERVVLVTLGFDLNVNHPYKPLVEAIKRFKVSQNALAQVAWNFVNDGLRTSLCLQFMPHQIAAGAIFLAAKFLKVKLSADGEKSWWQEFDVTPRQLEDVSNQMLELYEQNRSLQSSNANEVEGSTSGGANNLAVKRSTLNSSDGHSHASEVVNIMQAGFAQIPPAAKQGVPLSSTTAQRMPQNQSNENVDCNINNEHQLMNEQDAIPKIAKDKYKAAFEKRKKLQNSASGKTDSMNEDDLIEKEIETGIEVAAEDKKTKREKRHGWPKPLNSQEHKRNLTSSTQEQHQEAEEGEVSSVDEQELPSPGKQFVKRLRDLSHERALTDNNERDHNRSLFEGHV